MTGCCETTVQGLANPMGTQQGETVKPGSMSKRTALILEIIQKAGDQGANIQHVKAALNDGSDDKQTRTSMAKMAQKGIVFTSEGKSHRMYFATQEWAAACKKSKKHKDRPWNCMSTLTMRNACHEAVKFAGDGGILTRHIAEKLGKHVKTAQKAMNWLRSRGDVFLCVNSAPPRYFLSEEQAEAYMAQRGKIAQSYGTSRPKIEKPVKKTVSLVLVKREDEKSIKAPVIKWQNQKAIIPAGVKITVRNAPPGRFEATGQYLYFSALQIGSYKQSDSAIARAYG